MGISTIESLKNIVHGDQNEEEASLQQRNVYRRNMFLIRHRRPRSILMKRRRARLEGARRIAGRRRIERRVRTLKRLIPSSSGCAGLDGLFRDTADYILSLQMKVKMMQIMVKALSNSDE